MIRKITLILSLVLIGAFLFMVHPGFAKGPDNARQFAFDKPGQINPVRTLSNIGNWAYWMRYDGQSAHTPDETSGGFYPRGTAAAIYQDGFVWGAIVNGQIRVGGQTYRIGTVEAVDRIYRIRTDWRTVTSGQLLQDAAEFFVKNVGSVTESDIASLKEQYELDWREWPVDLGAPYVDADSNGVYNPVLDEAGNPIAEEGDYPGIANADQVVWFRCDDSDASATQSLYGSPPLGIELQVTAWAYNQPGARLGQILFKKYKFINTSNDVFDSMYVAQWCDPDVGNYTDDLVGCDPELSIGFAYNGSEVDIDYAPFGLAPPAAGYDFFQGPIIESPGDTAVFDLKYRIGYRNLPMTSFGYFSAGNQAWDDPDLGSYDGTLQWYNLLRGFITNTQVDNPTPFYVNNDPNNQATKFPLSGDPVTGAGDVDGQGNNFDPADRRMSLNTGPFVMQPGDTQEVVVAVLGGVGGSRLQSVTELKTTDQIAQSLYDNLFGTVPKAPPSPEVNVSPLENTIVLNWGANPNAVAATENTQYFDSDSTFYGFEGYNVYQLPNPNATKDQAVLIATFDLVNGVQVIEGKRFIPSLGAEGTVPVQFGRDAGVQRFIVIDRNHITGEALFPGNTYYFAVTAYNYNEDPQLIEDKALESPLTAIPVTTQAPKPGVAYEGAAGEILEVQQNVAGGADPSDGVVEIVVVDPTITTGNNYQVTFEEQQTGEITWDLVSNGTTVLENQPQLPPEDADKNDAPIVDGLLVKVVGPPPGINTSLPGPFGDLPDDNLNGWGVTGGDRWVSWTNWGGSSFGGGLDEGKDFFGSTITAGPDFVDVEVRFAGASAAEQPDRWSKVAVYRRDQGYAFAGIGDAPFTAWDIENNRQLNVCIVEDANAGNTNLLWDMGWDGTAFAGLGGREYVFIMNSDYNQAADYDDNNWGPAADVLYAFWPAARGSRPFLHDTYEMQIFANNVNTPNHSFSFAAPQVRQSQELAEAAVDRLTVYPNPYYAFNPQETGRFNKFVTFYHLPTKASIRIFDLAGTQVRKLEKNDDSQFHRWDLKNEAGLPVGSGIYIVHVDMPDLGKEKILKIFIIQEEQILEFF